MQDSPGGPSAQGGTTPEEALDRYIDDRLAGRAAPRGAGSGGAGWPELAGLVGELRLLDQAAWDEASPLFRGDPAPERGRRRRRHRLVRGPRRRAAGRAAAPSRCRKIVAGVAAAMVVAASAALATTLAGQPPQRTRQRAAPAAWRLAGYLDEPAWQVGGNAAQVGVAPAMTCPGSTTCYVVDPPSVSGTGVSGTSLLETTTDGGRSWSPSTLDGGRQFTSGLACSTVEVCVAGGIDRVAGSSPRALVLTTTDGGQQWHASNLPASVARLSQVACGPGGACVGAGYTRPASPGVPPAPVVATGDATGAWVLHALRPQFDALTVHGVACAGTRDCVLAGAETSSAIPKPVVLSTTDGGAAWTAAALPGGLATVRAVTCPASLHCYAVANPAGPDGRPGPGPSEVIATADGGSTWSPVGSSGATSIVMTSISCVTATQCWASGESTATPAGMVVQTVDGGTTWTAVKLPGFTDGVVTVPDKVDIQNVSSVSCAADGICTALGAQFAPPQVIRQVVLRSD